MNKFIFVIGFVVVLVLTFTLLSSTQNMVVLQEGNSDKKALDIVLGKYQDSDCGMIIDDISYAAQVVAPDGRTWFFHDHGGFVNWLKDKKFKNEAIIWVMANDSKKYIDGKKAYYSRTDTTPMGYGFGAYENFQDGFIDYDTMTKHMLRGETLNNPKIRVQLLGK